MSRQKYPLISVAVCTFNRHHLLRDGVEAILKQRVDPNLFKVLIVDNSSDKEGAAAFYRTASFPPAVSDLARTRRVSPALATVPPRRVEPSISRISTMMPGQNQTGSATYLPASGTRRMSRQLEDP